MNLKEILSISGQSGLYKYVAQGNGGVIVEAMDGTAKRQLVSGSARVSSLGDIAIFTDEKELPLAEVFTAIFQKQSGAPVGLSSKSTPDELAAFIKEAVPAYDRERVHNSDIKKLALWYNLLVAAGVTTFVDSEEQAVSETKSAASDKVSAPKAPRKPAGAKTAAPKAASKSKVTATKSTTARKAQ